MVIFSVLLDVLAAIVAYWQQSSATQISLMILLLQGLITVILLIMTFSYSGKKYSRIQTKVFMRYFSIRYSVIVISFILNAILTFLYYLSFSGTNNLFFQ